MLAKTKLNTIKVLIFKVLIDSYISRNEFVLVNNVLRRYDDRKEEMKNTNNSAFFKDFKFICEAMLSYRLKCRENTKSKINPRIAKTNKTNAFSKTCSV